MEKKYIILARYEVWTSHGKDWTKWFAYNTTPMSEKEANEVIKTTKKASLIRKLNLSTNICSRIMRNISMSRKK